MGRQLQYKSNKGIKAILNNRLLEKTKIDIARASGKYLFDELNRVEKIAAWWTKPFMIIAKKYVYPYLFWQIKLMVGNSKKSTKKEIKRMKRFMRNDKLIEQAKNKQMEKTNE